MTSRDNNDVSRVPSLDMIRGIAILLVVLVHSSQMIAFPGFLANVTALGRYGVPLFFVLSGFLMGSLHGLGTRWSLRGFVSRRTARLLPAWWAFLALWILAFVVFPEQPFALADFTQDAKTVWIIVGIFLSVALLNDLTPVTTNLFVPGGWSISAEAMHYALFPRLRLFSNTQVAIAAMLAGSVSVGAWSWIAWSQSGWTPLNAWLTTWAPWSTLPLFLAGLLIARGLPPRLSAHHRWLLAVVSAAAVTLSAWTASRVGVDLLPLVAVAVTALFVALYYTKRVPKWLILMGALSYEMYFTHFVVLAAIERTPIVSLFQTTWGGVPFFVLVVVLAAMSGYMVRWGISRPGSKLTRRIIMSSRIS